MPWKKIAVGLVLLVLVLAVAVFAVFQTEPFGGDFLGLRLNRMEKSRQYVATRFENKPPEKTELGLLETLRNYSGGQVRTPPFPVPVVPLKTSDFPTPIPPGLRAYWFGHASVLLEIDGVRLMTDPVFSTYASPVPGIGPKRMHPTPVALDAMPEVDAVVISHDHYDHLDMATTKALSKKGTHFFVGLGVGAHLERWGVPSNHIHEMDWWDGASFKGLTIYCTPARHYSGRKSASNNTLWASWLVEGPSSSFYYSGDTGYGPHFKEIASQHRPIDLAIMKVGSYGSTWLDIHMDPESSVQAFLDLKAREMLPVHWATFNLSYHSWAEPIERTLASASQRHASVITPKIGEKWELGKPFASAKWWAP